MRRRHPVTPTRALHILQILYYDTYGSPCHATVDNATIRRLVSTTKGHCEKSKLCGKPIPQEWLYQLGNHSACCLHLAATQRNKCHERGAHASERTRCRCHRRHYTVKRRYRRNGAIGRLHRRAQRNFRMGSFPATAQRARVEHMPTGPGDGTTQTPDAMERVASGIRKSSSMPLDMGSVASGSSKAPAGRGYASEPAAARPQRKMLHIVFDGGRKADFRQVSSRSDPRVVPASCPLWSAIPCGEDLQTCLDELELSASISMSRCASTFSDLKHMCTLPLAEESDDDV
eukprot:TRINITY_DN18610_c0_g1_i3.p1 TRINITY_DN18610_c0_g1~~TRINITY_DN18610_c0_g1_i3.p1  ORF type:complete len:288 (+),score=3.42 TRINITY_DN18610_c0_g1_i3:124-987(+)